VIYAYRHTDAGIELWCSEAPDRKLPAGFDACDWPTFHMNWFRRDGRRSPASSPRGRSPNTASTRRHDEAARLQHRLLPDMRDTAPVQRDGAPAGRLVADLPLLRQSRVEGLSMNGWILLAGLVLFVAALLPRPRAQPPLAVYVAPAPEESSSAGAGCLLAIALVLGLLFVGSLGAR
jgi:hypothetical protein